MLVDSEDRMPQYTLTIIDTTGVQGYIFGSNRLRENIGASQLVEMATHEFLEQSLEAANLRHNRISGQENKQLGEELDVEVVLQDGGNAVLLSKDLSKDQATAKAVVRELSRLLLKQAAGLEIVVAHHSFDWETQAIGGKHGAYNELLDKLNRVKQQRRPSTPLLGQGVTLECRSTGMPAVAFHRYGQNDIHAVSADVLAKVSDNIANTARARLNGMFENVTQGYEFRSDFDELGGTEDESRYIAVVHADGNGIGKRFEQVIEKYDQPDAGNRTCLVELKNLSEAVAKAGRTALQQTVKRLVETFKNLPDGISDDTRRAWLAFIQGLPHNKDKPILPFRPIVFGGDDVTFVCDGRLGLPLAAIYLHEWEQASRNLPHGGQAYACAGIAVVKTHYPFARAYHLCEGLCKHAKSAVKNVAVPASALDWHFALSGIFGSITQIREREYQVAHGALNMRPLLLSKDAFTPRWRAWPNFKRLIGVFAGDVKIDQRGRPDVHGHIYANRNKVKGLREALRRGDTENFCHAYKLGKLPELDASNDTLQRTGWMDYYCGYFDAIEALDFFLPLEP
jgi:hypothetical protein